ncbi:MAG: N-6 DNA Methylase [archaeon ADurb.Bin336]|nr:MAG: N-6 DNA Methylase [archaeon ADurb.Bin336]
MFKNKEKNMNYMEKDTRRKLGVHLTSINIFQKYILPKIKNQLDDYIWIDLYCGEGNLILPILNEIKKEDRINFFRNNIYLFDIQKEMVEKSIVNATKYGIPRKIAEQNIKQKDTLKQFPEFLNTLKKPIYHITNPPYLYLGYIKKHPEMKTHIQYFREDNKGYQDLYQIALMNDLRYGLDKMIYIIPSNFLFGASISNKIRLDFLSRYKISEAIIFEKKIFDYTGTNVIICLFERNKLLNKKIEFSALKINSHTVKRDYILTKENKFRGGNYFEKYIQIYKAKKPLNVKYYLKFQDIEKNKGENKVILLDSKDYVGKEYSKKEFFVNDALFNQIKLNPLFIRTVDTGSEKGRAGLYNIKDTFGVDGVFVKGATYRTNPIQLFIKPTLKKGESTKLKELFNQRLEKLRDRTDSEFMTTYKYSNHNSKYIRKYLGLNQAKKIIQTIEL